MYHILIEDIVCIYIYRVKYMLHVCHPCNIYEYHVNGVSQQKKSLIIIHGNSSSKLSRPMFVHQSTLADAGSVAPYGDSSWCWFIAEQHDMTNGAQLINRLNQPHILGNQTINLMYIYIYKCNNLCLNADLNVHLEGHLQKQKKLAKPTECDHQPRTNSEAATKQNRHISCLFAAMKLHYHYDMRNI